MVAVLHRQEEPSRAIPYMVYLTKSADKAQRKMDKPLRLRLLSALEGIRQDPEGLGERLSSPLTGIRTHHVTYQGKEYRIAYMFELETRCVTVLMLGSHENFYKRLKILVDSL